MGGAVRVQVAPDIQEGIVMETQTTLTSTVFLMVWIAVMYFIGVWPIFDKKSGADLQIEDFYSTKEKSAVVLRGRLFFALKLDGKLLPI